MATYDTLALNQNEGTTLVPRSGIRLRYASNGTVRARAQSSALRLDPRLMHKAISEAQWAALVAFHEANRGVTFTRDVPADGRRLHVPVRRQAVRRCRWCPAPPAAR
jgi:hypothetical protein